MIPLLLSVLLTGTPMGSSPSVDYSTNQATTAKNTFVSAFDGDLSTYFASYDRSNTWCGLDLGQTYIIDKVGWPRCGELDIIELGNSNAFRSGTQDRYFNGAMHVQIENEVK